MLQNSGTKDFRIKDGSSHCFRLALCHRSLGVVEVAMEIWDDSNMKRDPVVDITNALMNYEFIFVTGKLPSAARFEDTAIKCSEVSYLQVLSADSSQDK